VVTLDLKQQAASTEQALDIAFEGIRMELATKKAGVVKTLLDGSITGEAKRGRMVAILGPSGAGKSSVLHALAGRVQQNAKLKLYGRRFINGVEISGDSLVPAAFVEQAASFFPYMTVRETLSFRVELKLGSTLNRSQRDIIVDDLIHDLVLTKSADTLVGDDKVRGISGGERKRLSIAVEMINAPKAIFLDEPTSGLDSTAAAALTDTLRKLADGGRTVIAVIHQPSQHVFSQFDDVLLVSEGRQMYFGPRSAVRSHMETNGCAALPETGTAEHILDCISPMPIMGETTNIEVVDRLDRLAAVAMEASAAASGSMTKLVPSSLTGSSNSSNNHNHKIVRYSSDHQFGPKASLARQCKLLFGRALQQLSRGKITIILKLVQQLSTALIYGGIYNLGANQASIQDRFGLMSLIAIGTANVAIAQTIRTFPKEKAIVSKELSSQLYRTLPYFIGKAVSELPLTGILNAIFGLGVYGLTGMSRMKDKLFNFISILAMHGMVSQSVGLMIGAVSPNSVRI
jgi:ABC-type multidrug transport system ATPase subunit